MPSSISPLFQNCELSEPTLIDIHANITATFEWFTNTSGKIKIVTGGVVVATEEIFSIEHQKYHDNLAMIFSTMNDSISTDPNH